MTVKSAASYESTHLVAAGSMSLSEQLSVIVSLTASQHTQMKKAVRLLHGIGVDFNYALELVLVGIANRQIELRNQKFDKSNKY